MTRLDSIIGHPDFVEAGERIRESEKDRIYCRHDLQHSLDVARIAWIMALEQKLGDVKELIYAAALLHDMGRYQSEDDLTGHQERSAHLAASILKDSGFSEEETALILSMIRGHRKGEGQEGLAAIFYEADKASRLCFDCQAFDSCYWPEDKKNLRIRI